MKHHEIEAWALQIIDRVQTRQPIEDSRAELKSEWPEPKKAARQIAGHGNAARGAAILWIIGVDEKRGAVVGASATELANWYPAVAAQFDGLTPHLVDLNIPVKGNTVVALYFETDRAPFVVKNPDGGSIQFEVPWREGRSTKTADRSELLRILSPLQQLPAVDVLTAELAAYRAKNKADGSDILSWRLMMRLYIVPKTEGQLVIPFYKCTGTFGISETMVRGVFGDLKISPPVGMVVDGGMRKSKTLSETIAGTSNELVIYGPGKVLLAATSATAADVGLPDKTANLELSLVPAGHDRPVMVSLALNPQPVKPHPAVAGGHVATGEVAKWGWSRPDYQPPWVG